METQAEDTIERKPACPYCGGDEARCDFDRKTDHCSERDRVTERLRAIQGGVEDWYRRGVHKPHWEDGYYHGFSGTRAEEDRKGSFQQAYDRGYQVGSKKRDKALRSPERDD